MKITLTKKDKNTLKTEIINANGVFLKLEQIAITFKEYLLGNSKVDILNDLFAVDGERLKSKDENGRQDPRYQRIEYLRKLAKGESKAKSEKKEKSITDFSQMLITAVKMAEKHNLPRDQVLAEVEGLLKSLQQSK